jgi:hypothetical protein
VNPPHSRRIFNNCSCEGEGFTVRSSFFGISFVRLFSVLSLELSLLLASSSVEASSLSQ